jgi:hypothetical protein
MYWENSATDFRRSAFDLISTMSNKLSPRVFLIGVVFSCLWLLSASILAGDDSNDDQKAAKTNSAAKKEAKTAKPATKNASRKTGKKKAETVDPAEAEKERQEFLKKTGILLWPELTDEQQRDVVKKQKEYLEEVKKKVPAGDFQLYETNFFLFYSDIPPVYVNMYVPYLDAMYTDLCKAFGLDPKKNIFQGKCMVIAFATDASFQNYETTFFQKAKPGAQGICHSKADGEVIMACYAGKDPQYLATVMVHETSHGFMFRYKSNKNIPNWLNEGSAEWVAKHVIPRDQAIPRKIQASVAQMKMTGSMGGNFFSAQNIENWQYGLAASLTEFLLQYDAKAYRQMIDDIKLGKGWEDALKDNYKLTPEELAQQYGKWIGLPMLTP